MTLDPLTFVMTAPGKVALLELQMVSRQTFSAVPQPPDLDHVTPENLGLKGARRTGCAAAVMLPPVHDRCADFSPCFLPYPSNLRLQVTG
jgi:hypothetical protein